MLFYYTLFLFIAFGSKLVLALLMIYMLLPSVRSCNSCDGETILIRSSGAVRLLGRMTRGRIQQRWCPRCEWHGLSRRLPEPVPREPALRPDRPGREGHTRPRP
jgi:hypothetical protein